VESRKQTINECKEILPPQELTTIFCHALNQVYTNLKDNRPHGTHTAWAMLALIYAGQVFFLFYVLCLVDSIKCGHLQKKLTHCVVTG
jgi:hypothetical protein